MKYIIINNINSNFDKLLVKCINGVTYIPLDFTDPLNFEAFIVLNQIVEIYSKSSVLCTIDYIILRDILDTLINCKCISFTNIPEVINRGANAGNFKNTLMAYINERIDICLDSYNNSMRH